jgi:protein transport protein SEC61 subunit gamma-like protein
MRDDETAAPPATAGKPDESLAEEEMLDDEQMEVEEEKAKHPLPSPTPAEVQSHGLVHKAWGWQHRVEAKWQSLGSGRFARVLKMAHKPEPEEYRQSSTIVLVGIGVIGFLGFMVFLGMRALLSVI